MAYKINIRTDNGSWLNILQDKYIEHDYTNTGIGDSTTDTVQKALSFLKNYISVESEPRSLFNVGNNDWTDSIYDYSYNIKPVYSASDIGVLASDVSWIKIRARIPIDPNAVYHARIRVKKLYGDGTFYAGAIPLDNNYNELYTDSVQLYNYFCARNEYIAVGDEKEFYGSISGYNVYGGSTVTKFDPSASYFDFIVICNYNTTTSPTSASQSVIKSIEIYKAHKKESYVDNNRVYHEGNYIPNGNLAINGYGEFDNLDNFEESSQVYLDLDYNNVYSGNAGFRVLNTTNTYRYIKFNRLIPVDKNSEYISSMYVKSDSSNPLTAIFGFYVYDEDKNQVLQRHTDFGQLIESRTTLAADYIPGDTIIQLTDASGWDDSIASRTIQLFPYISEKGTIYDNYSYTRNVSVQTFTVSGNNIVLQDPSLIPSNPSTSDGRWPAGTKISEGKNNYGYIRINQRYITDHEWYYIGGILYSNRNTHIANHIWSGVKYLRPSFVVDNEAIISAIDVRKLENSNEYYSDSYIGTTGKSGFLLDMGEFVRSDVCHIDIKGGGASLNDRLDTFISFYYDSVQDGIYSIIARSCGYSDNEFKLFRYNNKFYLYIGNVGSTYAWYRARVFSTGGKRFLNIVFKPDNMPTSGIDLLNSFKAKRFQDDLRDVQAIDLGASLSGDRYSTLDFHSNDILTNYSARLIRWDGENGKYDMRQRGSGGIRFVNETPSAYYEFGNTGYNNVWVRNGLIINDSSSPKSYGYSSGFLEINGPASSMFLSVQDGNGRIQMKWNASYGTSETALVPNEHSAKWHFNPLVSDNDLFAVYFNDSQPTDTTTPISWDQIFGVGLYNLYYKGNIIYHEGNSRYEYIQSASSLTWVVVHNLGKQYVNVTVIDSNDEKMYPATIKYDSVNQLTITFSIAETGRAVITI